jgi:hypothetical protein
VVSQQNFSQNPRIHGYNELEFIILSQTYVFLDCIQDKTNQTIKSTNDKLPKKALRVN